jgi:hypothetical protein
VWAGFFQTRLESRYTFVVAATLTAIPFAGVHIPLLLLDDDLSVLSVLKGVAGLLISGFAVRLLLGVTLRGAADSVLAVGLLHQIFDASNNRGALVDSLLDDARGRYGRGGDRGPDTSDRRRPLEAPTGSLREASDTGPVTCRQATKISTSIRGLTAQTPSGPIAIRSGPEIFLTIFFDATCLFTIPTKSPCWVPATATQTALKPYLAAIAVSGSLIDGTSAAGDGRAVTDPGDSGTGGELSAPRAVHAVPSATRPNAMAATATRGRFEPGHMAISQSHDVAV